MQLTQLINLTQPNQVANEDDVTAASAAVVADASPSSAVEIANDVFTVVALDTLSWSPLGMPALFPLEKMQVGFRRSAASDTHLNVDDSPHIGIRILQTASI